MNLEKWAGIAVPAILGALGLLIEHWQTASQFFLEVIVKPVFVNLWWVWLTVILYGVGRGVQFVINLHRSVKANKELAERTNQQVIAMSKDLYNKMLEEKRLRIAQDNSLSGGLSHLDAGLRNLADKVEALQTDMKKLKGSQTPAMGAAGLIGRVMKDGGAELLR